MSDEPSSPFDEVGERAIRAYVVDQRSREPRLRGYPLGSDLARHYSYAETMYLALMGDFPSPEIARLFEVALIGAMNIGIADAAVHASRLSRHLADGAGMPSSVIPTAAISTAEMTRTEIEELDPLYVWLHHRPDAPLPKAALAREGDGLADALRTAVGSTTLLADFFERGPSGLATVVALLYACGITDPVRAAAVISSARLPVAAAEAFAVTDSQVWQYPLNLPYWDYQPGGGSDEEE